MQKINLIDIDLSGISSCNLQSKTYTANSNGAFVISPDSGYNGMNSVSLNVNVPAQVIKPSIKNLNLKLAESGFTTFDFTTFDWDGLTDMSNMFEFCRNVTSFENMINFVNINSTNGTFSQCNALVELDPINMINVTSAHNMFAGCGQLTTIKGLTGLKTDLSLNESPLSVQSILQIFNDLADLTGQDSKTLTLGEPNLAKVNDDQKSIATNKNWILA